MEGGTGVYYQAMPAVGPDGKNVMKLIPVQKVNGQFYQTPFNIERDNMEQLKAFPKLVHSPAASSSQTQTRLPSLQPIADGRVVLKTLPEFRTLSNAIKSQPSGTNNFTIHNSKQVHVPLVTNSVSQYAVQLSPQTNGQSTTAVQMLPVTVKSPVLPNGHFLQIPPNAKVRTLPASALPPSIKCRIMNSVNNSTNLGKGPPTVVLVSPVNSVKLNSDQQMLLLTKPSQIHNTLFQIPSANLQTPVCVPKTNEEVNTPIKWVVQEGTGATAPYLIPLSTPNASSDSLKTANHVNTLGTANEITASKATHLQTSTEKITPGKDNALVMCNGKVYFVAKKNSEIAKDVMISEGGKHAFVSISPALPASSALGSNSSKRTSQQNVSEIIDLCDDDHEASTCLGGAPGNLPTPSQTVEDESDEDSNVIFVSYIPPKSGEKVAKSASQNECEEVQHTEINTKSVSLNEVEKTAHAEIEEDCVLFTPSAKTCDETIDPCNVDEQVKENEMTESNLNCVSENVNMETDKCLESRSGPETEYQADLSVAETVCVLEQPQNVETTDSTEKVIENPAPDQSRPTRSDCQLRKEFGITSYVLVCLQRTEPAVKLEQQTERLIINKRTLDGLRKVIQDSPLQSKIHQMMQVPYTKTEDDGLKVKKTKQEQDGNQDIPSPSTTNIPPPSKCSVVPMENSLVSQTCQEEVCSPAESSADKVHMESEIAADSTGNTCHLTSSPKQKASETAEKQPISARKTPPRSKKGKVCTACPCGTVLGVAEATSSLHPQEKPNPCTVVESQKGTRRICLNKTTVENHQPKDQDPVKKARKKQLSRSPRKVTAPVERSSESSHNISHNSLISSSSSSNLLDCNSQTVPSSSGTKCDNVLSSHTDAETSQQDTSQVETASNDSITPFSTKHPGPKIDNFPTEVLYSMETLDAEEIKRQERIKRLKDLLKEKEAALERMQQSMSV